MCKFTINDSESLSDLPGYFAAKSPVDQRNVGSFSILKLKEIFHFQKFVYQLLNILSKIF